MKFNFKTFKGGLTGECYLVEKEKKRYILRECNNLSKAKFYFELSNIYKKENFLPKLISYQEKEVLYEYIQGRDLFGKNERISNIMQIGEILGLVNKKRFDGKYIDSSKRKLKEMWTGKYNIHPKAMILRKREKIKLKPKKIITKEQANNILSLYVNLKKKVDPEVYYDCGDPHPKNFRLRNGKVYLTDIESIKPRYKGHGIMKFLHEWGKTKAKKEAFLEGYSKKSSLKYFTKEYQDFLRLNLLITTLNWKAQTNQKTEESLNLILDLIKK